MRASNERTSMLHIGPGGPWCVGVIDTMCTQVARKVIHYATLPSLTLVVLQHAPVDAITVVRLTAVGLAGVALTALSGW